ncbi:MAG: LPS export ABC transporter ATP-binding protein, partial [Muribaculaceae bacterium]|nr:LPS export ABC transporter ATP-binding protein [Muribaculaceae bacterium]
MEEEIIEAEPERGILRTKDLVKKYGKRTVANKVSIYVRQGAIVCFRGS